MSAWLKEGLRKINTLSNLFLFVESQAREKSERGDCFSAKVSLSYSWTIIKGLYWRQRSKLPPYTNWGRRGSVLVEYLLQRYFLVLLFKYLASHTFIPDLKKIMIQLTFCPEFGKILILSSSPMHTPLNSKARSIIETNKRINQNLIR